MSCVRNLYGKEKLEIFLQDVKVGKIRRYKGIVKGCKASLVMFILCMNRLIEGLNNTWKNERYNMLMFLNDVIILGSSRREVKEKVNVYKVECRMLGLRINAVKSETMKIGKNKGE